jgi:hypothetical protein
MLNFIPASTLTHREFLVLLVETDSERTDTRCVSGDSVLERL